MSTPNERIRDGTIRHKIFLERFKAGTVKKIIALLNKADDDLADEIAKRLARARERGADLGPETTARLKELRDTIKAQRADLYELAHKETRDTLREFSAHEADFQVKLIEASIGSVAQVTLARPSLSALRALVDDRPIQGKLLKDWFSQLSQRDADRVTTAIRLGITEGQTTEQIVRRIRGTRAMQYEDGILQISRREAAGVVNTAAATVSNQAAEDVFAANADIFEGMQWLSTLDSRTCPVCASRDGQIYEINKPPIPPAHHGPCRCRRVPFLGETITRGKRASMFGPVPDNITYPEWLAKQSPALQEEMLGPTRAKLYREGGLTLDRFSDPNGRPYTLDQLKKRDAEIWNEVF